VDLEQITLQELAQAEAVKVNGLTHGAAEAAEAAQVELDKKLTHNTLTLEDTLDTLVDQEHHQKDHQVVDQVPLTQMIQDIDHTEVVEVLDFTVLQAAEEAQQEDQVVVDLMAEVKEMQTTLVLQE
jgi:hypothetical protein